MNPMTTNGSQAGRYRREANEKKRGTDPHVSTADSVLYDGPVDLRSTATAAGFQKLRQQACPNKDTKAGRRSRYAMTVPATTRRT